MGMAPGGTAHPVITWEGLLAWSQLMHTELAQWEAHLMMKLSCVRANVHAEQALAQARKMG